MEEFLEDYISMIAETQEKELNNAELTEIVKNLMNNDELWDTFDSFIYDEMNKYII